MAIGKEIENRGHIVGFKEEISKAADASNDDFFTWFDGSRDTDAAFVRGGWDFMLHIAHPASAYLTKPEDKIALEIGHGGGRILSAASRYFKAVIGVDIHDNNQMVIDELKSRGIHNFQLIKTTGDKICLEDSSLDFVYSFIVFQHVEKFQVFKNYLKETSRILKPGGIAVLYFGRKYLLSINKPSKFLYLFDRLAEKVLLPNGYKEMSARVNCTNLLISVSQAKQVARNFGFEILEVLVSHKNVPDGTNLYGGQNGLLLRKK
ncbi:MAG: methyltransferase domain-containing protein [Sulfurimonas sp.]|nr:methyltransferase domain-containing protein [Sulfurimonas sp.]